jgi:hypothetical protein
MYELLNVGCIAASGIDVSDMLLGLVFTLKMAAFDI